MGEVLPFLKKPGKRLPPEVAGQLRDTLLETRENFIEGATSHAPAKDMLRNRLPADYSIRGANTLAFSESMLSVDSITMASSRKPVVPYDSQLMNSRQNTLEEELMIPSHESPLFANQWYACDMFGKVCSRMIDIENAPEELREKFLGASAIKGWGNQLNVIFSLDDSRTVELPDSDDHDDIENIIEMYKSKFFSIRLGASIMLKALVMNGHQDLASQLSGLYTSRARHYPIIETEGLFDLLCYATPFTDADLSVLFSPQIPTK